MALAQTFERQTVRDDAMPLPTADLWPNRVASSGPAEIDALPVPGAQHFKYSRPFLTAALGKPRLASKKPAVTAGAPLALSIFSLGARRTPWVDHQFPVARPPSNIAVPRPPGQSSARPPSVRSAHAR